MSGGIIQNAIKNGGSLGETKFRPISESDCWTESEQPTVADLVAPGTGHPISSEFERILGFLIAYGEPR